MSSISAMTKKMAKPPSWNAMGTGTDNNVAAIYALDSNNVYVGGAFTNAGGVGTIGIAKWDGINWSAMGTGLTGNTPIGIAIHAYANNVYVGGRFTRAGGLTVNNIAVWK